IRSLTLPAGFSDSIFPSTSATPAGVTRASRTSGVFPIRSSTLSAIPLLRPAVRLPTAVCPGALDGITGTNPVVFQLACGEVADRHPVEDLLGRAFDGVPNLMRGPALVSLVMQVRYRRERPLERPDDVAEADLFGPPNERVTALGPADAPDESRPSHRRQKLVQVRLRDALPDRDPGTLHRPLAVMMREF